MNGQQSNPDGRDNKPRDPAKRPARKASPPLRRRPNGTPKVPPTEIGIEPLPKR